MGFIICDSIISFFEMMISLFFATGIFHRKIKGKKITIAFILFSVFGAVLLTLREYVFTWFPDFVPAVLIFTLYTIIICRARWWAAVSWALVNYLFIGIIAIGVNYIMKMGLGLPVERGEAVRSAWFFAHFLTCIITRIGQFLLAEIILCVWKRFPISTVVHRGNGKIIIISSVSIIMLWILLRRGDDVSEEVIYSNSLICLLVLVINLAFLIKKDRLIFLVFTTALKKYAPKGYEVQAFRYLIKPLGEDQVFQALTEAGRMIEDRKKEAVIVTRGDESRRIFKADIYYIEVDNHHIILHLKEEIIRFKAKLKEFETQFKEPQFCKCHRSYIVNLKYTGKISREGVEIDGKETLPISKTRWEALNHCYMEYYMA